MARVTNQDLANQLTELSRRLDVIEAEAKVAKWVLRLIATLAASIVGLFIKNHAGHGQ